jgi:hypothetical protein
MQRLNTEQRSLVLNPEHSPLQAAFSNHGVKSMKPSKIAIGLAEMPCVAVLAAHPAKAQFGGIPPGGSATGYIRCGAADNREALSRVNRLDKSSSFVGMTCRNEIDQMTQVFESIGAGEGNSNPRHQLGRLLPMVAKSRPVGAVA